MIVEIIKYKTDDGLLFATLQEAKEYEYNQDVFKYVRSQVNYDSDVIRDIIEALQVRYEIELKDEFA